MDNRTIYSKTGKGSLEITKKTIKLASDERQALILVDGKSNVGQLEEKLSRVAPPRLRAILEKLASIDLIRELVTKQGPDSIMPTPGSAQAAMNVMEVTEADELDFTALSAAAASAAPVPDLEVQRKAREDAERRAAEEAALRRTEEEARRKKEEEAQRKTDEDIRNKAQEEARRHAAEEARRQAEELVRRKAKEAKEAEEAKEEARRKAEEEARQKAVAEARRQAEEAARQKAEAEARRRAEEEARQKAEAEARRKAEDEARRQAEADARRREAEMREAEMRAAEQRQRAEAERLQREQNERRAREEAEARERARREEETRRSLIEEEKRRRAAEEARHAAAAVAAAAAAARPAPPALDMIAAPAFSQPAVPLNAADEAARLLDEEVARYTAGLTPHLEEAAAEPPAMDLDFHAESSPAAAPPPALPPLSGGGPDTFAYTSMGGGSAIEGLSDDQQARRAVEKASRKQLEKEAKEAAKAAAKAKKEADRAARELARSSKVRIRRGPRLGVGKIIFIVVIVALAAGVGYLYFMPVDKDAVERVASSRLGEPVKVGSATFAPFPPQLTLTDVAIGDIRLARVVAIPDPGSLASAQKIWTSIDIGAVVLKTAQLQKLIALAIQDPPHAPGALPSMTIQRVRVLGVTLADAPVPVPVFNATAIFSSGGDVKEATFALADGKGQASLAPGDNGWTVDLESKGEVWGLGPKVGWESLRAKGVANANGVKFDSIGITQFGGTLTGPGELSWNGTWKFAGSFDISSMETDTMAQTFYGTSPISGTMDGKINVKLASPTLAGLFSGIALDGDVSVNKATIKNVDLARTVQTGAATPGETRFCVTNPDVVCNFTTTLGYTSGKLQLKNIRGASGLLNVTGSLDVTDIAPAAPQSAPGGGVLNGTLDVEIGNGSNRNKASLNIGGTVASPKFTTK
jgi:hypothetical protein